MSDERRISRDVVLRWFLQESLDARYRALEKDPKLLKSIASQNNPDEIMDAVYKQLEFWGEATWGEAFPFLRQTLYLNGRKDARLKVMLSSPF